MSDLLRRDQAPITGEAWKEIEEQAVRVLRRNLSARPLVDFQGPLGLQCAAVNLGRLEVGAATGGGLTWGKRQVLPLIEFRMPFTLGIWDLDDLERGAKAPDLEALKVAARQAAIFEETAIYLGFQEGGIQGMVKASPHAPVALPPDRGSLTEAVERGIFAIKGAEVGGPYALVLGAEPYQGLMVGEPHAYPLRKRVEALATGGIHWSPALEGGVVLSLQPGSFELTVGQDLTIGYHHHDARSVELFLTESFTFRVLEPGASVALTRQAP